MHAGRTFAWIAVLSCALAYFDAAWGQAYESEILAYEQQDLLAQPPRNAIVVTGSSTIAGWWAIRNDLAPLEVIPRGFGGSTADDLDYYLDRIVLKYEPRAVGIYEGDNDIAAGFTPEYVASRMGQIAARITARFPGARIYIISIKPSPLRWGVWPQMQQANQLLVNLSGTDARYRFVDTASALLGADGLPRPEYYTSDGLHLSAAGYTAWNSVVRPALVAGEQTRIVMPGLRGQDVGTVANAGAYSESGGVYTLRTGGVDIWGTADAFRYAWQPLTGDGHITARVASQSSSGLWAKAGVMLREQLTASSRHAFVFVTPSAGAFMQYRTSTGGSTGPSSGEQPGIAAPYWVRLVRKGNVVTGYLSANGITWTTRGSVTFSNLPSTVYVGLAASSYSTSSLGTVVFDNVSVPSAGTPPPPPPVDVTPPTIPTGLVATAIGANQVNLSWNASSDSGTGVAGYRVLRNGVAVGTSAVASYSDTGLSANTLYTYTVRAFDAAVPANESSPSAPASATTPVASAYQSQDIGAVVAAGSYGESGGVYTLRTGGVDIWGTADAFRYAWQPLTGNGQITARVVSQSNSSLWAKAGVMLREQLTASSRHAFVFVTPSAGAFMQYRTSTGGSTGPSSGEQPGIAAPYWVRLVRNGNVVTGYLSANGITWTTRGSVTFSNLPSTVYVGLAASSYNASALGTVVFDNVSVPSAGTPPPPPPVDVTPPTIPTGLVATAIGANQVNLSWNASSDSGTGVAGYRISRNGVAVGTSAVASYSDTGLSANTLYTYTVRAFDAAVPANESSPSAPASATTPVASAYQSQDIGAVVAAGSYGESGGVYTLRTGGVDIWGTADAFRYAWQPLTGNGQITARVVSQSNSSLWAKAGVMLREQLTASSRHAFVFVTPSAGAFMQYRTSTGGSTGPSSGEQPGIAAPYWVRLVRNGNVVTGYLSANGITWTTRGSVTFSNLPSTVYVGLAASSYNASALGTVLFDNVSRSP